SSCLLILQNYGRCTLGLNHPGLLADDPQLRFDGGPIVHVVIPIRVHGTPICRLISGPFAVRPPEFPVIYELARSLPVHPDNLMKAAAEVPVVAQSVIMDAAHLVHTLVKHVVSSNYRHQSELTVLRSFDSIMTNLSYEVLSDMILNLGRRLLNGEASLLVLVASQGDPQEA